MNYVNNCSRFQNAKFEKNNFGNIFKYIFFVKIKKQGLKTNPESDLEFS